MIRRSLDELVIFETDMDSSCIHVDQLKDILTQKTSEIVYFTRNGQLYGIVSTGDIIRVHENKLVEINTNFISMSGWNVIRAKKIFTNYKNVHKIPVVDRDGKLVGDYSRWDDLNFLIRNMQEFNDLVAAMLNGRSCGDYFGVLIHPGNTDVRKLKIYKQMKAAFDKGNTKYVEIYKAEVLTYLSQKCAILFVDQDDLKGTWSIWGKILDSTVAEIMTYHSFLLKGAEKKYSMMNDMAAMKILKQIQRGGIKCYTLSCRENINGYLNKYIMKQTERLRAVPKEQRSAIRPEIAKDFFGELYTKEYWEEIVAMPLSMQSNNGVNRLKDTESRFLNVKNGERKTYNQPKLFNKTIHFFGPCIIIGRFVEDQYTIESFLQDSLNRRGYLCKVVNYGCWNDGSIDCGRIMETQFKKGDIVIVYSYDKYYEGITDINIVDVAETSQMPIEWTTDDQLVHCNHKANKVYAEYILDKIENDMKQSVTSESNFIAVDKNAYIKQTYVDRYFKEFKYQNYKRIGAIVMNCNPFTLGHRYLIEKAYGEVDFLIIFIVEENKSVFNFEERFAMVREGTKDLEHIIVVPSGNFILSQTTFPEYFIKIADEDIVQNVDYDITLFAEYIAKPLHINCRFVGEEINDFVTRKYNEAMKRILPSKGIELIEIKRINNANVCISASLVRRYLEDGEHEKAWGMVPNTTKAFL